VQRILIINYEYPPLGGGAGNATAHTAREMVRQGARVLVVTSAFKGLPAREAVDGYAIRRIPTLRAHAEKSSPLEMAVFMASACLYAPWIARAFRPTAVIAYFGIPSGPAAWLVRQTCGAPYAVSLRGGDVPGFQPYDLAGFHRLTGPLIRFLWQRAGAVVANSQGLAELAARFEPGLAFPVIPNGADIERFHPRDAAPGQAQGAVLNQASDPARENPVRLLFYGRVVYQKGLDVLLEALAALPSGVAQGPAWELSIAGDGPARPELEAQAARLGIADQVRFLGWKERDELARISREMDCFVFASRDEGMSNAVLEAMASGLPVVASRIAGNVELVEEGRTGWLVPPDDPAALALALAAMLESPERRAAMGRAGRLAVETGYTWNSVAARYLALCGRMSAARGR